MRGPFVEHLDAGPGSLLPSTEEKHWESEHKAAVGYFLWLTVASISPTLSSPGLSVEGDRDSCPQYRAGSVSQPLGDDVGLRFTVEGARRVTAQK